MSLEIEATYENCILKLDEPLPLRDHERVVVTVRINPVHASGGEQARRSLARERLLNLFARIDEKTTHVSDDEMETAIEEAMQFVRNRGA